MAKTKKYRISELQRSVLAEQGQRLAKAMQQATEIQKTVAQSMILICNTPVDFSGSFDIKQDDQGYYLEFPDPESKEQLVTKPAKSINPGRPLASPDVIEQSKAVPGV